LWDFDIPHAIIDPSKESENTYRPTGEGKQRERNNSRPTVLIRKIMGGGERVYSDSVHRTASTADAMLCWWLTQNDLESPGDTFAVWR
jgi:hypothetical protein